jgi:hypothetical protein
MRSPSFRLDSSVAINKPRPKNIPHRYTQGSSASGAEAVFDFQLGGSKINSVSDNISA